MIQQNEKWIADLDWSHGIPYRRGYYLCEVKGIKFTKYMICQWEDPYWMTWLYFDENIQGWFGLKPEWHVNKYVLIEEL